MRCGFSADMLCESASALMLHGNRSDKTTAVLIVESVLRATVFSNDFLINTFRIR
jgi:hypothetical protein